MMLAPLRPRLAIGALLAPALVLFAAGFFVPMFRLAQISLATNDDMGVLHEAASAANYVAILTSGYSLGLIWNSLVFGLAVSLIALVLAYPAALFLHRTQSRWRGLFMLGALSPLFISSVVRTYGWTLILGPRGVINSLVLALDPGHAPLRLMNDMLGCYIGMVQIILPYMVLCLLAGAGRLTPEHEEAADTLGASPLRRFLTVTAPLTAPGAVLGLSVCFVLTVSSFVTPSLLGGGRVCLLATEIYNQAIVQLEWPLACSLSVILLAVFGGLVAVYTRLTHRLEP